MRQKVLEKEEAVYRFGVKDDSKGKLIAIASVRGQFCDK